MPGSDSEAERHPLDRVKELRERLNQGDPVFDPDKWRAASFAGGVAVEFNIVDEIIGMRRSDNVDNDPTQILLFTRAEIDAFVKGTKAKEFDDFT